MLAPETLPETAPQSKVLKVVSAQTIAELTGAAYMGPQPMDTGTFHYFREPVTGSTVGVWDRDLSFDFLQASMKAARLRFGVA